MQFLTQALVSDGENNPGRDSTRLYMATALHSGKAMTVDGANTVQKAWTELGGQQWKLVKLSNGNFKIENPSTGKVLDVEGGSTADGARVLPWSWHGGANQQWKLIDLGNGQYRIQSVNSGKVIDVPDFSLDNGRQLVQWTWNGGDNQKWQLSELRGVGEMFNAKATLYEHGNYGGNSTVLGPGAYDIGAMGLPNDCISSLRVPRGLRVTLYEHANFRGRHKSFSSDASYVGDDFNDITSGILVEKVISIYMDANYGGASQTLGVGRYRMGDITLPNDNISSLRVPQGMMVTMYEHDNFTGRRRVYFEDTPWVGNDFNDLFSSIVIKATGVVIPKEAIQYGAKIRLTSTYGKNMVVEDNLDANANRDTTGDWTRFTVVRVGPTKHNNLVSFGDVIALRHWKNGGYVNALDTGSAAGTGSENGAWTKFLITRAGQTTDRSFVSRGDKVALKSVQFNRYLRATSTHDLRADTGSLGAEQTFTIAWFEPPPAGSVGAVDEGGGGCGVAVAGWSAGGVGVCGAAACGADVCGAAACGAAAALLSACGAAASLVTVCAAAVAGAAVCGAAAYGATAVGIAACGADACGAAACGAAACGADACGAAASATGLCGANACAADVAGIDACPADACAANTCGINLCPADACAADACAIDIIPIIPFI
ncbi:Cys-every-fifth RiPP peptide CefA [Haliangium sp.]|uniref:Cys-every-fifth RiPP peptide CefA n=1 Tax=Haliangium sp. TaxID=2663208 RepID=UPI003D098C3E